MKAIMPKPFKRLSQSEKNAIYRAVANLANEQTDKEEAELQKYGCSMRASSCITLSDLGKSLATISRQLETDVSHEHQTRELCHSAGIPQS